MADSDDLRLSDERKGNQLFLCWWISYCDPWGPVELERERERNILKRVAWVPGSLHNPFLIYYVYSAQHLFTLALMSHRCEMISARQVAAFLLLLLLLIAHKRSAWEITFHNFFCCCALRAVPLSLFVFLCLIIKNIFFALFVQLDFARILRISNLRLFLISFCFAFPSNFRSIQCSSEPSDCSPERSPALPPIQRWLSSNEASSSG